MSENYRGVWRSWGLDPPEPGTEPANLAQAWEQAGQLLGLDDEGLALRLADAMGLEVAPLVSSPGLVTHRLPQGLGEQHACVAFLEEDGLLHVASADPGDPELPALVMMATGLRTEIWVAPPARIAQWQRSQPGAGNEPVVLSDETDADDAPTVQFVATLLGEAVQARASDIHLQPLQGAGLIRLRVDGVLVNFATVPIGVLDRSIGRIKAVSGMDPANRRVPQDGRCTARIADRTWDLRIAILPVDGGERMVIRLLGGLSVSGLPSIGLRDLEVESARDAFRAQRGLFVISGPTGSGKSTTLYAALHELNRPEINVVTVEDPVEYRMPGVGQCEVDLSVGLDFAAAIRQMMRQDPNVILVGEMRDEATADAAFRAALTGHHVLTTLHAGDAMGAVPRLRDLGLRPRLIGDALAAVSAQRLLRKLCPSCRVEVREPFSPAEQAFAALAGQAPPFRAGGCPACQGTGYRGRLPILEVVPVTPAIRELIHQDAPYTALLAAAREAGAKSLGERASIRILLGDTTAEESLRVLGETLWSDLKAAFGRSVDGALPGAAPAPAVGPPVVLYVGTDPELPAALAREGSLQVETADSLLAALAWRARGWNVSVLVVDALAQGGDPARFLADARAVLGTVAWRQAVVLVPAAADAARRFVRQAFPGAVVVDPTAGVESVLQALGRQLQRLGHGIDQGGVPNRNPGGAPEAAGATSAG